MSKAPSMPMYWDSYIADTTHLVTEEHGAYLLLLAAMWRRDGSVPDDDKDIARIVGLSLSKWLKVRARLGTMLQTDGKRLTQKKLQEIWKSTQERIEKNKQNGSLGGRPKANQNNDEAKANGYVLDNPNETIPEPEPLKEEKQSITDSQYGAETDNQTAFKEAVSAQSKLGRSRLKKATAWSLWQRLSKQHGEDRLLAAYLRYLATDADAKRDGGAYQSGLQVWLKEKSDQWLEQGVRRSRPVDVDTIRAMIKTRDATPSFAWPEDRLGMTESEARKMIA
ncbi:MAG: hypothetical protein CFE27_14800 [Alphaproteobacteria bacterium PA1]|nr:MAG: hypothetical protein CFE27_14800 [Alphaproteobacteria bacterium PA1]